MRENILNDHVDTARLSSNFKFKPNLNKLMQLGIRSGNISAKTILEKFGTKVTNCKMGDSYSK